MATGTVTSTIKRGTTTVTLDASGRGFIAPADKNLVNVMVENTAYVCLPRYTTDGTLVYVYTLNMQLVTTQPTVTFTYLYY